MPQPSLNTVFLCPAVSRLLRVRAISKAARHPRAAGPRDHADRDGHVLGWTELAAARHHVAVRLEALVVLAHDDEVDILVQRAEAGERPGRPHVGEQVEMLAQDRVRVDRLRHLGILAVPDRPQDEAVHPAQGIKGSGRHGGIVAVQRRPTDRHGAPVYSKAMARRGSAGDLRRSGHDLMTDIVAVEDSDHEMGSSHASSFKIEGCG
jgi:hypothetical protein